MEYRAEIEMLREALRKALPFLESLAEPQAVYGFFHGGDPRDFTPDPEASTEQERTAHQAACSAYASSTPLPGCCEITRDEQGKVAAIITRAPFGLGVSHYQDADALEALECARAALSGSKEAL